MGNILSFCLGKKFDSSPNEEIETAGAGDLEGEVHIIIAGIDYSCDRTWAGQNPLDTRHAFDIYVDLARRCECATIKTLWNEQCTKQGFLDAIEEVGQEVGDDDYFIFYYTGHGDRLVDDDGDEASGRDSALCLLGDDGNTEPRNEVWLRDDDFAEAIMNNVTSEAKIIALMDCCHSGTVMDFGHPRWAREGFKACSITGCEDNQTSAGTGKGGMFSRALSRAIQELQETDDEGYMTSTLYNTVLQKYQEYKMSGHTQSITIHGVGVFPQELVWPLQPEEQYTSPANTYMRDINIDG